MEAEIKLASGRRRKSEAKSKESSILCVLEATTETNVVALSFMFFFRFRFIPLPLSLPFLPLLNLSPLCLVPLILSTFFPKRIYSLLNLPFSLSSLPPPSPPSLPLLRSSSSHKQGPAFPFIGRSKTNHQGRDVVSRAPAHAFLYNVVGQLGQVGGLEEKGREGREGTRRGRENGRTGKHQRKVFKSKKHEFHKGSPLLASPLHHDGASPVSLRQGCGGGVFGVRARKTV